MNALQRLGEGVLDLLFPRRCVCCSRDGAWACEACLGTAAVAWETRAVKGFEAATLSSLEPGMVRELVHVLKYNGIAEAAETLADIVVLALGEQLAEFAGPKPVLVPVPTSTATVKRRGYNQAELIACALGSRLGLPVASRLLVRANKRGSQVGKGIGERQRSLEGAFLWRGGADLETNSSWLVVDDVLTTGATIGTCMGVLAVHVTGQVRGLALARAAS